MRSKSAPAFDSSVSLVRLIGMVCILLCHLFSWFGVAALAQLFNVGVPVFLLISGFLYGGKTIRPRSFFAYRYLRITLPVGVFVLLLSVYLFFFARESANFGMIPLYMLNLEGCSFVCGYIPYAELCTGTGHLWFLTVLMLCYICLPFVQKAGKHVRFSRAQRIALLVISCAVVALLSLVWIYLSYFQIFFIGYACKKHAWQIRVRSWLFWTGLMAAAVAVRLFFVLRGMDDSAWYLSVVSLQQNMLAFWIFSTVRLIYRYRADLLDTVMQSKAFRHADELSFYVYIVHYMFLVGPFDVADLGIGRAVECCVFLLATVVCAEALRGVTILLQKAIALPAKTARAQT